MSFETIVVDVLSSGVVQGAGPLYNIISAEVVTELDKAGQVTVTVPALSQRAIDLVAVETELNIRTEEGIVGRGLLQTWGVVTSSAQPVYTLTGPDLLGELMYLTTGYGAGYDNALTGTSIIGTTATTTSLLGGTGWTQGTVTIVADYERTTIDFEATTRLSALIQLCKQIGHHFRQGSTARTLDAGVFGTDSGIRILNPQDMNVSMSGSDVMGYISQIAMSTISADLENKMFPLGKDKFDLRDAAATITDIYVQTQFAPFGFATTSDDAVSGATIPVTATTAGGRSFRVGEEIWIGDADDWTADHEYGIIDSISAGVSITLKVDLQNAYAAGQDVLQRPQFYIKDDTSISAYGTRESCPQFPWIGKSDTAVDITIQEQAAATLYWATKARMTRYKDPYEAYTITQILDLPTSLQVGDKVRVTYKGMGGPGGNVFLDINDDFYVMKITRRWDGSGMGGIRGICSLDVANVSRPTPDNLNLLVFNLDNNRWIGL